MPAKFSYDGKDLSVNGYIQIFYHGRNGTVRNRGKTIRLFTDGNAMTICNNAGYGYTIDGWSSGKYCDGKGDDRSSLRCLISGLMCFGSEGERIEDCRMDPIIDPTKPPPAAIYTVAPTTQTGPQTTQLQTTVKPTQPEYELAPLTDWDHKEDVAIKCNF